MIFGCPFTSTCLFVQEFVTGGTVTLVTDPPVSADVGAAAVVVLAFVYTCRRRRGRSEVNQLAFFF